VHVRKTVSLSERGVTGFIREHAQYLMLAFHTAQGVFFQLIGHHAGKQT
jgi:hypothetical protein